MNSSRTKLALLALVLVVLASAITALMEHASTAGAQAAGALSELRGVNICFECHDAQQTASFHYPDRIMAIEEKKDQRRRICVDCHGPAGNNPDSQMTDPRDIVWVANESQFKVSSRVVHAIHGKKIEIKAMECETCHLIKNNDPRVLGEYPVLPQANPGQILVCQICHLPSDPGNYIRIHIISGHQECTTCHTGDIKEIHKRATAALGSFT